jgi:cyclopropane-fatty-acyl-phospholipid synthase
MSSVAEKAIDWTESGLVPDSVIRSGIRRLLEQKRREIRSGDVAYAANTLSEFVEMMRQSPIALVPERANEQHYEVPAEFFTEVLGKNRKYSCCHWSEACESLDEAEADALQTTVARAGIEDGMQVLDLGCGWGSLSLWIAEHFPGASVTAVSNSRSQRDFILYEAAARGIANVDVIVCDMNDFSIARQFDRIVSVEMFEHMRNYEALLRRVEGWLLPEGRFFMHIFTHRSTPYEYTDKGPSDWMTRHFFSGGIMPSASLPAMFQQDLSLERQWAWNGLHYAKTCRAWLANMDSRRTQILPILARTYGDGNESRWFQRWRIFFMACEELFRYEGGNEWFVSHYLFRKAVS